MHDNDLISKCIDAVLPVEEKSPFSAAFSLARERITSHKAVAAIQAITVDKSLLNELQARYEKDPWCKNLISASRGMHSLVQKDGLWFLGS